MPDTNKYIWYAAYGSNLSPDRFLCYVQGGRPEGAARTYAGCRDTTPPLALRPLTVPHALYFAMESKVWGGGMAMIDHPIDYAIETLAAMYLITQEQFEDLVAQENALAPRSINRQQLIEEGRLEIPSAKYGRLLYLGQVDNYPILSFTSPQPSSHHDHNPPSVEYLATMARGLRRVHRLESKQIIEYLTRATGSQRRNLRRALLETI